MHLPYLETEHIILIILLHLCKGLTQFITDQIITNVYDQCYPATNYTLILTLKVQVISNGSQSTSMIYPGITDSNGQSTHVVIHHIMH